MGSTVLEIGNAAAQIVGLPTQTTLIGNTNQNAVKIFKAVKDAAGKYAFRDVDWVTIEELHTFTTDGSSSYSMPDDYDRIVNGTIWDQTNYRKVIGPMTSTEWQKYKSGLINLSGIYKLIRIAGDGAGGKQIEIFPETDTGSTITFEYITNKYVISSTGTLQTGIIADNDTFMIEDDVIESAAVWCLLRMLGLSYGDEKAEYKKLKNDYASNDSGAPELNIQLRHVFMGRNPHIPDTGYGA